MPDNEGEDVSIWRVVTCCRAALRTSAEKGTPMELGYSSLASTGDNPLPFIIGGVIAVALVVLVIAFIVSRRKK